MRVAATVRYGGAAMDDLTLTVASVRSGQIPGTGAGARGGGGTAYPVGPALACRP